MVHFYKHVSFLLALLSVLSAFSQKTYYKKQASTTESCATHTIHNKLIQTDPTYKANYLAAEKQFQKALKSVTANTKLPVYSVPVVVHVIHLGEAVGTGTNISDAQIQSAITAINDDFRKKTGTNGDGAGVDSEIEFCLAVRDPSGNATTGINRVNGSGVALYSTEGITAGQGQGAIEVDVKALSRWPNTDYYNIWIVNEIENNNGGGGIQGYAYYPGASSLVDGSVIMYNAFGTVGNLKSYTDRNRVATHELGHGFNLRHTFNATTGCTSETNCNTQGDQCCDTPPHPGNNTSCFTPECSSTQQVANYMDYTGEDCQDMFSQNQSDRMRATFSSTRASLLSSQGCVPVASGANSNLKLIAGGQWHSVTLCSDSTVWATGYNANGQLGDGTTTNRLTPVQVTGIASVIGITASGHNSFALKNDSTLWAWGGNNYGSLGDGTTTSRTTPVQVTGLSKIISIEAGVTHTLALKNDGTVWAWGENSFGQLGDGTTVNKSAPIQVSGLTNMVAVAAAYLYSVALKNDGTVWAWGRNTGGTLGNGTNTDSYVPVQTSISNVSKISVYGAHVLALKNDGTVWTWGWNNLGQLGDGTTTDSNIPVQASGLTNIIEVAAGNQHSMALKNDSTVWAWGINTDGQLGIGNVPLNSTVPIQVTGISGVVDIAAGNSFSIVQRPTGDVYTWGINDYGELGDNTTTDRYTPVQMQLGCAVGFGICGISTTITTTNTTCNGGTDGSANLTPSDGAIPYSYSWSNGATTQDLSGIAAGTYYVTVTDNNSCTKVDSAVISEPAGLSLSLNTTSATCVSCTDGSIDLTVSGGTTPYTYSWSNSAITEDISGLTPSMYYVTVTDNNSCTAIDSALVDSCAGVSISVSSTNATCNGCTDGTTSVITPQSNKFKPYTPTSNYNTFYGGYNLSYINDSNFTNGTIWGSGTPDPYELTMTFTTAVKLDTVKVKGGQFNGNFNIPIEMKLYRGTSGGTLLTTINPTYTLDKYGFSNTVGSTVYTWVIRPAANGYASIREIQCFETPPNNTYTYQWNDAGNQTTTTATGLGAGTYHVTVTDQNSCTATDSATVTEPAPCLLTLSLSSTNATCNGSNDGTIDLTPSSGTTPYAYSWSNGAVTQDISGLTAGTYYVTVTDNNSCTKVDNATITEPAAISLSLTATNASCNGCTDGSVDLTATNGVAPYTYSWSNGAATQDISALAAGTYYVTVTDNNSCTTTDSSTITEPPPPCTPPSFTLTASNITCNAANDGSINLTAAGAGSSGKKNYTPTSSYNTFYGTYNLSKINDGNLGSGTMWGGGTPNPFTLTMTFDSVVQLDSVKLKAGQFNGNYNKPQQMKLYRGTTSGTLLTTITPTYTFDTYTFSNTVTDLVYTFEITPATNGYTTIIEIECYGSTSGASYTYAWTGPNSFTSTAEDIASLEVGWYYVTVTESGCNGIDSAQITEPTALATSTTATNATCSGCTDGSIDLTASGGTTPYTYSWSTGAATEDISGLAVGSYYVTVTDNNSCTAVDTASVILLSSPASQLEAALEHTLYLCSDSTARACGVNSNGQLGDGTTANKSTPVQVIGLTGITAMAIGGSHSFFLKSDSTVWASGLNFYGQLGDGTTAGKSTPVQVSSLTGITAIAGGFFYSLFLKNDGTVWACGRNNEGQLGDGTTVDKSAPVQVSGLTGITAIAAGSSHSLFLKNDGTVWACGENTYGQLGDGTTADKSAPVQVSGLTGITAIEGGNNHSLFLKNDGTVWACGRNDYGQLGDGTTVQKSTPVQLSGLAGITAIEGGGFHSLFLKNGGTVWACGTNGSGQLGDGTTAGKSTPVQVSSLTGITAIAGGMYHSLFLKNDGTVWACGDNTYSQLGDGTTVNKSTPVQVIGLCNVGAPCTPPTLTLSTTNATCSGCTDGAVDLTVSSGTAPYTYNWSTGAATEDISGLAAGTYYVTVTDANSCTATDSAVVSEAASCSFTLSYSKTDASCASNNDGSIDLTVNGNGSGPGGLEAYTATSSYNTFYSIYNLSYINDGDLTKGTMWGSGTPSPFELIITFGSAEQIDSVRVKCGQFNGNYNKPQQMKLYRGTSSGVLLTTITPDYTFSGYAFSNTSSDNTYTWEITPATSGYASILEIECYNVTGVVTYTYAWAGPNGFTASSEDISNLESGAYNITATDNSTSCSLTENINIIKDAAPMSLSFNTTNVSTNGGSDGAIDMTVAWTAHTSNYNTFYSIYDLSYIDDGDLTKGTLWGSGTPNPFELTITFGSAEQIDSVRVKCGQFNGNYNKPQQMKLYRGTTAGTLLTTITPTYTYDTYSFSNTGSSTTYTWEITPATSGYASILEIEYFEAGGASTYTYSWAGPNGFTASTEDISAIQAGTYNVTITNISSGCGKTASVTVTEPVAFTPPNESTELLEPEQATVLIRVYPNPTDGILNINISGIADKNASIVIYDSFGREVYHSTPQHLNNNYTDAWYFSNQLPSGIYLLAVQTGDKLYYRKIILER